jgi:hypothetical protein
MTTLPPFIVVTSLRTFNTTYPRRGCSLFVGREQSGGHRYRVMVEDKYIGLGLALGGTFLIG